MNQTGSSPYKPKPDPTPAPLITVPPTSVPRAAAPTFDGKAEDRKRAQKARKARWTKRRRRLGHRIRATVRATWSPPGLLFESWVALTAAVILAIGHWPVVVATSIGLLLSGFYGWRTLFVTFKLGLRGLSHLPRAKDEDR